MATITVRDLDEATRSKLRIRAARNGRSMEAEVRDILTRAVTAESAEKSGLGSRIHALFAEIGGTDDVIRTTRSVNRDLPFSLEEDEDSPRAAS